MITYRYMLTLIDVNRSELEFKLSTKESVNWWLTKWLDVGYTVSVRKLNVAEFEKYNKHLTNKD